MAIRLIAELAKLTLTSVCKCQGNLDMVVGSQVYYSTIKSCEVFILSFLFYFILLAAMYCLDWS